MHEGTIFHAPQSQPISSHLQIYPACPAGRRDPGTWETRQLATAIYPTMALLNHSCDNNVTKGHKNT